MFKYLLVVFVFCYQTQGYASAQGDTTQSLPTLINPNTHCCNEITEEIKKKPVITMNGHNNYHVGQQIFYIYNEQKSKIYPDGYVVTSGIGAHKVHTRKLFWNKARQVCFQEGGHLAVINSDFEEKILLGMLKDKNISAAWLGLHDQFEEGDWITIHDVALENTGYTKWSTKWAPKLNPDNFDGNQNCATLIQPEGGMDDLRCTTLVPFICEIPA